MVVTPYEMQRQAGWAPLEHDEEGVLGEGRISAASPAEALCQLCSSRSGLGMECMLHATCSSFF